VELTLSGADAAGVKSGLAGMDMVERTEVLAEEGPLLRVRAYPKKGASADDTRLGDALAGSIAALAARQGWKVEGLHTEPGRLDEVFRSLTWSDVAVNGGAVNDQAAEQGKEEAVQ